MAKTHHRHSLLTASLTSPPSAADLELDELDIWGLGPAAPLKPTPRPPLQRRKSGKMYSPPDLTPTLPSSLPVSIPDWSKIAAAGGEVEAAEEPLTPPHELMWQRRRSRMAEEMAFSLEEGVGRTLKGRDLSRLRNAIWEKIGFQD